MLCRIQLALAAILPPAYAHCQEEISKYRASYIPKSYIPTMI
jgi:hypothetical protein